MSASGEKGSKYEAVHENIFEGSLVDPYQEGATPNVLNSELRKSLKDFSGQVRSSFGFSDCTTSIL